MMRFLVICLLLAGLAGCSTCPPEYDPPSKVPFYVNNSGVDVNLILVKESRYGEYTEDDTIYHRFTQNRFKQEIKNNDTLCNSLFNRRSCSREHWSIITYAYENPDFIPAYFIIEFLGEPKTCLVFDGDKIANDIRYWENYALTEETPEHLMYYYYINSSQMAMAKEEFCH